MLYFHHKPVVKATVGAAEKSLNQYAITIKAVFVVCTVKLFQGEQLMVLVLPYNKLNMEM